MLRERYASAAAGVVSTPTSFRLPGDERPDHDHVPYGSDAVALLSGCLQAALSLGHNYIGTEHLLLAAHQSTTVAGRLLDDLGIGRDDVSQAVEAALVRHVAARRA